jgi:hypothetical protein
MVLDVLAEAANAPIATGREFNSYWTGLKNLPKPVHLPLERQMRRLNQARVALKHHGQRPSSDQLLTHLENARAFIEDVCDQNFGTSLAEISLIELIKNEKVRNLLRNAQEAVGRNDLQDAFTKAALGFAYGSADVGRFVGPPLLAEPRLQHFSFGVRNFDRSLRPLLGKIDDTFKQMANRLDLKFTLVLLGVDGSSYTKFQQLTPAVSISVAGIARHVWFRTISGTPEDATWCINFVQDFMLRVEGRST